MTAKDTVWRQNAEAVFRCRKAPATGDRGVAVTNHPLASGAAMEILLDGGNAFDAAIAAVFALTVVEPMMVGVLGGGLTLYRTADGAAQVIDGNCLSPRALPPDFFTPTDDSTSYDVERRENAVGEKSVAVPGFLPAWCMLHAERGSMPLPNLLAPAIRLARKGFAVTPYLNTCIGDVAEDLIQDPAIATWLMPGGSPVPVGERLRNPAYADALDLIGRSGAAALHGGPLGSAFVERLARGGGVLNETDLSVYSANKVAPLTGRYRGHDILSPPPPSAAGVHILQMLKILEGFDSGKAGFGSVDAIHLLLEAMKIAFADREMSTADPAFVDVPVSRMISAEYADLRRAEIDMQRTRPRTSGLVKPEGQHTTHMTVADSAGNVVCATYTISALFGARILVPETGMIPNNYMAVFDPRPGRMQSILPGKRVTTSMGPTMIERDGRLCHALGLPGGKRIFPSVLQAIVNLIDHGMSLQEAVEAPRVFTDGGPVEIEDCIPERTLRALRERGHATSLVPHVAGGMNGIEFHPDGSATAAACWRADGTAVALGGGLAEADVRFWPDQPGGR